MENGLKDDVSEVHQIERIYYYNFGEKIGLIADEENMLAYFLDEGLVGLGTDPETNKLGIYLNVNDVFGPGSDAEELSYADIPAVYAGYKKSGFNFIIDYVREKRKK